VFVVCRSGVKFPKGNIEEPLFPRRPFLNTSGAVIYASAARMSFYITGKKETFSFEKRLHKSQSNPDINQQEEQKQANVDRVS